MKHLPYYFDIEAKGRRMKDGITRRYYRNIENTLKRVNIRYWRFQSFWNPYHKGRQNDLTAGMQSVEFLVELPGKRVGAIIVNTGWGKQSGPHEYHLRFMRTKKRFLDEHGIPYLWLPKGSDLQQLEVWIRRWYRKMGKEERPPINRELRKLRNESKRPKD